jgi:hypothetical protein
VEFGGYSPCIFNGNILFMARAVAPKNRIGYYYDQQDHKRSVSWTFKFIGKVHRQEKIYRLFNELIFTPGLNKKIFNLENKPSDDCQYIFDKRFNAFSILPRHGHYKTTIRFSGFQNEIIYCSEFAEPSSPPQKCYDFVPDRNYCFKVQDYIAEVFSHMDDELGKHTIQQDLIEKRKLKVLAPYSGKVYEIGHIDFSASAKGGFTEWNAKTDKTDPKDKTPEILFIDHYRTKYGIEIPPEDQTQILLVAFPTIEEDVKMKGKNDSFRLLPSLCYALKEWDGLQRRYM